MPAKKLVTLAAFREAKFSRNGYVVIVDITGSKLHMPKCTDVDIAHFREKVMHNQGKNGEYYFVDDIVEGMIEFKAKKCLNCKPK